MKRFTTAVLLAALALLGAGASDTMRTADAPSVAVAHNAGSRIVDSGARITGPNIVKVQVHKAHCSWKSAKCFRHYASHNSRVDAGASAVANNISGTQVAVFKFIALSADTTAVVKTDTICPSEITTGGLGRGTGTFGGYNAPTVLNGSASYTVTATYTATASYTINKLCLFNAASSGTMLFETILGSAVTGNSGDVITATWTVNE